MGVYTSNTKLYQPAVAERNWNVGLIANMATLDALAPMGGLCVTTTEVPSSSLNVAVAPGPYLTTWGQRAAFAGSLSTALTASVTNYVYLSAAGTLTLSTTSFPASLAHIPLAVVVTGAGTVTSIADARTPLRMNVPIAEPTMGAATAGSTYGTNEQTMLGAVYAAVRALGLGS